MYHGMVIVCVASKKCRAAKGEGQVHVHMCWLVRRRERINMVGIRTRTALCKCRSMWVLHNRAVKHLSTDGPFKCFIQLEIG